MNNFNNPNTTLQEITIEDYIWFIYLFLVIFALISNHYEKEFITTNDKKSEKTFHTINTTIFTITFFIYLYFVYLNYHHLKSLNSNSSKKQILLANASFIAAIFFLIAGIISLLVSIFNDNDDLLLNLF